MLEGTGDREICTTMAFVRILTQLLKDKNIGKNIVPIVPDEARTFGMEGLFRQIGIYSSAGQLYTPVDSEQLMSYREDKKGQMLEEGINEAGSTCSWIAAGTAYANHGVQMVPFYIYYSMFGFQRVGDFYWAAGDLRTRGFLLGATAGRTTLAGEGLQHQDGHSLLHAATVPNCVAYDPTYAYELAVIIHDGLRRMYANDESVFFYIAVMNENYLQPAIPKGVEEGILKGLYLLHAGGAGKVRVTLMGSGTILRECIAAADILAKDFGIPSDIYSAPSFSELRREALEIERWNRLHPGETARVPYVSQALSKATGPFIAATDYMRAWPDMIRQWVPGKSSRSWEPMVSAGLTVARRCANISKSTRKTSPTPRCSRWPRKAPSTREPSRRRSASSGSTPTSWTRRKHEQCRNTRSRHGEFRLGVRHRRAGQAR